MSENKPPTFDGLLLAYEWVSADIGGDNAAYVSRATGRIYWFGDGVDLEEDLPKDIEDGTQYLAVPHKYDLNLGNSLALQFVHEVLPDQYHVAADYFHHRGAYHKFKAMLERSNKLDEWHKYEADAVAKALGAWVSENKLPIPLDR